MIIVRDYNNQNFAVHCTPTKKVIRGITGPVDGHYSTSEVASEENFNCVKLKCMGKCENIHFNLQFSSKSITSYVKERTLSLQRKWITTGTAYMALDLMITVVPMKKTMASSQLHSYPLLHLIVIRGGVLWVSKIVLL